MTKKTLILALAGSMVLLLAAGISRAQMIKEFHRNKNDYIMDITAVMEYSNNRSNVKQGKDLLIAFAEYWESGYFKPQIRDEVYNVSNSMLAKAMRSYPHFYHFIAILNMSVERKLDERSLLLWLNELDSLGQHRSVTDLPDFLEYSYNLFKNKMLLETRSRAWYYRNGDFTVGFDSSIFLNFTKVDLICSTGKDSVEILNTIGKYYVHKQIWVGDEGKISWRRAGFHEDSVYAMLSHYHIDLNQLSFKADSSTFYNKKYFTFPVLGVLTEKVLSSAPGNRAAYPKFDSYTYDHVIDAFYENVNCIGGLSMEGRKLVSKGDGEDIYAKFIFEKGGEYFAVVRCSQFEVEDDEIVGAPASFSIYFENDSIYHPGLQMRYNHKTHLLSLIRLNRGTAQSPFFNAFHNVNMYAEALYWAMNSEEISFEVIRGLSPESRAGFESDKYYSAYDYYRLQGIDEINPLIVLKRYSETFGTSTVTVNTLAGFIKKPVEQAIAMLLLLESKGFVVYNSDKREAVIKPRLYDYLLAHTGDTDYDVLRFDSHTWHDNNAEVELATFDMLIKGVPEIFLSDSQQVYIYPQDNRFVMKKNKDFTFSGRVRAGLFDFFAQDCSFEYDSFRINLPQIDSMSFFVRVPDRSSEWKENKYVRVKAVVENMNGFILIDKPNNKAGLKTYPQYPIFTSIDNSFVYYDKVPGIEGIYDRENFYYELDPFTLDSLDNFSTTGLRFKGYLSTGGILPNLEDELVVQQDFSLGVNSYTDVNGLPLYGGLGRFYDTVRMDNSGLHGEGRLEYLTSMTETSDMMLYPDSVVSTTRSFNVNKLLSDVEYADVSAGVTKQYWYPDSNLMVINMIQDPFRMFDNTSSMRGSLFLTPGGLTGTGDFTFERAVIESEDFVFGHHSMSAESSDFRLYTDTTFSDLAFLTYNYRADLDFDQRNGKFISASGTSLVNMPFNQFICYMDEINWEMDEQTMKLRNNILEEHPEINNLSKTELIDSRLEGSDFISTRPDQDSLRFFSTSASYDLNTNVIDAEDVKIIRVADAAIFPGDGRLTILKNADIETLHKAEIITDTANKYHSVYNANVDIFSRHKYAADGTIDYYNVFQEVSPVFLDSIGVDVTGRTFALGYLDSLSGFHLNPWYAFNGGVHLRSADQFLRFSGGFAIEQDCYEPPLFMTAMDTLVDPRNIIIPVPDSILSPQGDPLYASLMFSPDDGNFYPAFFSSRKQATDMPVFSGKGYLQYLRDEETFRVSDTALVPGEPYLSFHSRQCLLEGTGTIDLDISLPYITFDMYGQGMHYMIPDSTKFNVVLGLSFFFDPAILGRFSRDLNSANLPGAVANTTLFNEFLRQRMEKSDAERLLSELNNYGYVRRMPASIKYTMLFNAVKFAWNKDASAMLSYGGISIFSVGEEIVNKVVPGYIEVERPYDGRGEFTMYFSLPNGEWYYFNYRNYIMQTLSSNEGYNNEILNLNFERRITVDKEEKTGYEYVISSQRKVVDFKRRLEEVYGVRID